LAFCFIELVGSLKTNIPRHHSCPLLYLLCMTKTNIYFHVLSIKLIMNIKNVSALNMDDVM